MKADTPDLEMRKAMAVKLGWTHLSEEGLGGNVAPIYLRGTNPAKTKHRAKVPPYELSMDALMRDAVPWARERGYSDMDLSARHGGWIARFATPLNWEPFHGADTPAKAFCQAVLKLP